jgi:hypothetical protein
VKACETKAVAAKAKEAELYWHMQASANTEALASQAALQAIAMLKEETLT